MISGGKGGLTAEQIAAALDQALSAPMVRSRQGDGIGGVNWQTLQLWRRGEKLSQVVALSRVLTELGWVMTIGPHPDDEVRAAAVRQVKANRGLRAFQAGIAQRAKRRRSRR